MIIDLHEKFDVNPEWFEKQALKDAKESWEARLCQLLSVYKVKDPARAATAAKKMIAAGVDEDRVRTAME